MAKKRYYQGKKDRRDESRAMNKAMGKSRSGYDGILSEDMSAPANVPQKVVHGYYPDIYAYPDYRMENSDNIKGIDSQIMDDEKGMKKHMSKSKY